MTETELAVLFLGAMYMSVGLLAVGVFANLRRKD